LSCPWNLIGALFDAATAERYDLVNRVVAPEDLTVEVEALCRVMLRKHPLTVRRTKFIMNKGADLHISGALAFEVPITPFSGTNRHSRLHRSGRACTAARVVEGLLARPRNQAVRNHRIRAACKRPCQAKR